MSNTLTTFNQYLIGDKTQSYLEKVLGDRKEQFVTNCIALVSNNEGLQNCDPITIMFSAMKATSLGLPLDGNLGFAYVIPYNNKKKNTQEAQLQLGYKAFIQLAMRSNQFKTLHVTDIKQGEILNNNRLTGKMEFGWLSDQEREEKETIGFIAYFKLVNGFEKSLYMSVEELKSHGLKYSNSYKSKNKWVKESSLWNTNFEQMAQKTVLKLLLSKYAPMSITKIHEAIKYDQSVINENGVPNYVDNKKTVNPKQIALEKEYERITKHINNSKDVKTLDLVKGVLKDKEQESLFSAKYLELSKNK